MNKRIVFNIERIDAEDVNIPNIFPLMKDFYNHLTIRSSHKTIIDYDNCVVFSAIEGDGTELMLVLIPNFYANDRTIGIANVVKSYMDKKHMSFDFVDNTDTQFNYEDFLSKENEDYVYALRQEAIQDAKDDTLKYGYLTTKTREEILAGNYKTYSRYELQCKFMDAIRKTPQMTKKSMLNSEIDKDFLLNEEEKSVIFGNNSNIVREPNRKNKEQVMSANNIQIAGVNSFGKREDKKTINKSDSCKPKQMYQARLSDYLERE